MNRSAFRNSAIAPLLLSAAGVLVFLLIWEAAVRFFEVKSYLLPPPSEVFVELFKARARIGEHLVDRKSVV